MLIKNTDQRYGIIAIFLHWLMAILILGLIALGWYMTGLVIGIEKLKLYGWHKEFGVLVLMLVVLRLIWRLANNLPSLASLATLERWGARTVHWAFYGFMFAVPISGWMMSSATGLPVSFFGLFVLPDLISANEQARQLLVVTHKWLAYGLLATICLHIAAALKHHFINKDDILKRML